MQQSLSGVSRAGDHLQGLDSLLEQEEAKTGKRVFKRGSELRKGLIDVKGVFDTLKIEPVRHNEREAWKQAMKMMKKDPKLLLEAVPTIWD